VIARFSPVHHRICVLRTPANELRVAGDSNKMNIPFSTAQFFNKMTSENVSLFIDASTGNVFSTFRYDPFSLVS
jgi:hypothetical protein